MDLQEHYNALWNSASAKFKAGDFEADPAIDDEDDRRFGITLLARPSDSVKEAVASMLHELQDIEPELYVYPLSDMHITVMSIISCYDGFALSEIRVGAYEALLTGILEHMPSFEITFNGITASPASIMVQGFPTDGTLHTIRDRIRERFKSSLLQQSIDRRYAISTAHSTVVRFPKQPQRRQELLQKLSTYRSFMFGAFEVRALELVYNDWYQRHDRVIRLKEFKLL